MKIDKFCLKCDDIYETNSIFCPKCGTILKPSLVKAKKKVMQVEAEKLEESKRINFKEGVYDDRKSPDMNSLMLKYPRVKVDLTYRLKPITVKELAKEIENSHERYHDYSCKNCINYALGYCLLNLWNIEENSLCKSFEFSKKLKEPIFDKCVQQLEFERIIFDKDKLELQRKYSYQVIYSILTQESEKVIHFFNKTNNLSILKKVKRKNLNRIESERIIKPFTDINDLINRTKITDPIGLLVLRILIELEQNNQDYVILKPPTWIKEQFHVERII